MKKVKAAGMFIAAALSALVARSATAAVPAEEAKQLGTTLTEWGAEKAGNADGSIPPYTGGIEKVPGFDRKTSHAYVDPFANDKPLYTIDAKNLVQYADQLTEGTKALFRAHPDYKMDVYPTHRSMRYPQWTVQNTLKNANTAKLVGAVDGDSMAGADKGLPFPGIPFPIPKTGTEAMWNHKMHVTPAVRRSRAGGYLVDTSGRVATLPLQELYVVSPWYDTKDAMRKGTFNAFFGFNSTLIEPPSAAGTVFLNFYLPTADNGGQKVWFYTPGQRRVRLAPEFAYDVPIASYGGVIFWDDICGFAGRLDRFEYKLAGKKEMVVPYNVYSITNTMTTTDDFLGPKFVKPAGLRFEKHRVWVVDSVRKPGVRHAYARRTFYLDEDSWQILANETYDNSGKVWRVSYVASFPTYDLGGMNGDGWITYDLMKGNYFMDNVAAGFSGRGLRSYETAEGMRLPLTPAAVEASGVR
jgi:hypothetical protein